MELICRIMEELEYELVYRTVEELECELLAHRTIEE